MLPAFSTTRAPLEVPNLAGSLLFEDNVFPELLKMSGSTIEHTLTRRGQLSMQDSSAMRSLVFEWATLNAGLGVNDIGKSVLHVWGSSLSQRHTYDFRL